VWKKKSSEHDITLFDKSKPIKTTKQEGQELSIEQEGSYTTDMKREREKRIRLTYYKIIRLNTK
jgi:hypothetical protein